MSLVLDELCAASEPAIDLLAKALAGAELNYRDAYQRFGGSDIRTGRAWDKMRKAGDAIREHFASIEDEPEGAALSRPSPSGESVDETLLRKVIDETWGEALEDGSVPSTKLQDKILAAVRAKAPLSQETK